LLVVSDHNMGSSSPDIWPLFTSENTFGRFELQGSTLRIPIRRSPQAGGYPTSAGEVQEGFLVFYGLRSSRREVTEYIGDPKDPTGFKQTYVIEDCDFEQTDLGSVREFGFEGISDHPVAWVDWVVFATSWQFSTT
jgi:hypothetical protein